MKQNQTKWTKGQRLSEKLKIQLHDICNEHNSDICIQKIENKEIQKRKYHGSTYTTNFKAKKHYQGKDDYLIFIIKVHLPGRYKYF